MPRFILYECAKSITHGERRLAKLLSFSPDLVQFDHSQTFKLSFYISNLSHDGSASGYDVGSFAKTKPI